MKAKLMNEIGFLPLQPGDVLCLTRDDVLALGGRDMAYVTEIINRAFVAWAHGDVLQPAKTSLRFIGHATSEAVDGFVNILPGAVRMDGDTVYGAKLLGTMPANSNHGIPSATGVVVLFDDAHKMPVAFLDAQVISAMRTGAVSALAAQRLCRSDTVEIGCVGAGVNAYTQLLGVLSVLKHVKRVKIYSRGASKYHLVARLIHEFPELIITPAISATEAVQTADLVITCAANVDTPVVRAHDIKRPGITIFNIGCLENEPELLADMDMIVSDFWEHTKHRGVQTHAVAHARGLISDDDVVNLGDILSGASPGRCRDTEMIFFGPTGLGMEDVALGSAIYQQALQRGIGTVVPFWRGDSWI